MYRVARTAFYIPDALLTFYVTCSRAPGPPPLPARPLAPSSHFDRRIAEAADGKIRRA